MKRLFFLFMLICTLVLPLGAQSAGPGNPAGEETGKKEPAAPLGYRNINLGMTLEEVKEVLKDDIYFDYQGDPDVSFRPGSREPIIAVEGNTFIDRAYFQFYEKKLFIILLMMDSDKIDHFSLYTSLVQKYGEPGSLSPEKIIWEFEKCRLALERPLSVKYIDLELFNRLKDSGQAEENWLEMSREDFLNQF